jgi:hypothetical protein
MKAASRSKTPILTHNFAVKIAKMLGLGATSDPTALFRLNLNFRWLIK